MDTLVVMGTSAAYFFSLAMLIRMGDNAAGHLYFEAAAVIITLILLGKILEARAKRGTTAAIYELMALRPQTANVLRGSTEIELPVDEVLVGDIVIVRPGERITCEYVLMAGETDGSEDARRLARLLHDLPARLNLIPWNPSPGLPHTRPDDATIESFRDELLRRGLDASIRFSRGGETAAACGQLVTSRDPSHRRQHS